MEELFTKGIHSVLVLLIAIGLFLFWINMVIDCLRRPFKKQSMKVFWFFIIVFLQSMGALIYWFAVQRKV